MNPFSDYECMIAIEFWNKAVKTCSRKDLVIKRVDDHHPLDRIRKSCLEIRKAFKIGEQDDRSRL